MKKGWIRSIRSFKKMVFISVTDGQDEFQLTLIDAEVDGELKVGSSFIAEGKDSTTPKEEIRISINFT